MNTIHIKAILMLVAALLVSACATLPRAIPATFVSPGKHNTSSCEQIATELGQATEILSALTVKQKRASVTDTILMGTGIGIAGGALFGLLATKDHAGAIAQVKGEQIALITAAQRQCPDLSIDYLESAKLQGTLWCVASNRGRALQGHCLDLVNKRGLEMYQRGEFIHCPTAGFKRNEEGVPECTDDGPVWIAGRL